MCPFLQGGKGLHRDCIGLYREMGIIENNMEINISKGVPQFADFLPGSMRAALGVLGGATLGQGIPSPDKGQEPSVRELVLVEAFFQGLIGPFQQKFGYHKRPHPPIPPPARDIAQHHPFASSPAYE